MLGVKVPVALPPLNTVPPVAASYQSTTALVDVDEALIVISPSPQRELDVPVGLSGTIQFITPGAPVASVND
jgi:hypothetical protein